MNKQQPLAHGLDRRTFLKWTLTGLGALVSPHVPASLAARPDYQGPNVIIIRFGGGVRRQETIDPQHTYAPFLRHEFAKRGTLFTDMRLSSDPAVETSHGQGTLNILIGRYLAYRNTEKNFIGERFEASQPTLFEYLRKAYAVPPHQAVLINGEDRTNEEFYAFSNHHTFGIRYRCSVLSLYRFKTYLLRRQLQTEKFSPEERQEKQHRLEKLEAIDYRNLNRDGQGKDIEAFWESWRQHYGESGLVNPRGDRLLTELAIRAMAQLRPRLMMINYNDPDYVHWGYVSHYTRGIAIIDEGLRRLVDRADADPFYRDNTIFVVVPDCGRDNNRYMAVPYQHHFNSPSSREIFALFVGPGIVRNQIVDRPVQQIAVAPTIGHLMGFQVSHADAPVLVEAVR